LRFIHPLWLDTKTGSGAKLVVRIWGRSGETVELHADDKVVAGARIGPLGWVEVEPRHIRPGSRLWASGRHGHRSHVITAP
jgi:hypothetical protein